MNKAVIFILGVSVLFAADANAEYGLGPGGSRLTRPSDSGSSSGGDYRGASGRIGTEQSVCPGGCSVRSGERDTGYSGGRSYVPLGPSPEEIARQNRWRQAGEAAALGYSLWSSRNWDRVIQEYTRAYSLCNNDCSVDFSRTIIRNLALASVNQAQDRGDHAWNQKDWRNVIYYYSQVLQHCANYCSGNYRDSIQFGIAQARGLESHTQAASSFNLAWKNQDWRNRDWGKVAREYEDTVRYYQAALKYRPNDKALKDDLVRAQDGASTARLYEGQARVAVYREEQYSASNDKIKQVGTDLIASLERGQLRDDKIDKFFGTGGDPSGGAQNLPPPNNPAPVNNPSAGSQAASAAQSGRDATASRTTEGMKTESDCQLAKEGCKSGAPPVIGSFGMQHAAVDAWKEFSQKIYANLKMDRRDPRYTKLRGKLTELYDTSVKLDAVTKGLKDKGVTDLKDLQNNPGWKGVHDEVEKTKKEIEDEYVVVLDPSPPNSNKPSGIDALPSRESQPQ